MTPEERDRLVTLETRFGGQAERLERIEGKLDGLLEIAGVGRGAWWLFVRLAAIVAAIGGATAWAAQHLSWRG